MIRCKLVWTIIGLILGIVPLSTFASPRQTALNVEKSQAETRVSPAFGKKLSIVEAFETKLPSDADIPAGTHCAVKPLMGLPTLHINGEPRVGLAMLPEPYAYNEGVAQSCRDFAAAGINLYSVIFWSWTSETQRNRPRGGRCDDWWLAPGKYDFTKLDARIRAVIQGNPRGYLFPRIKLSPPEWWLREHPEDITAYEDGGHPGQAQASLASKAWEAAYERMLRDIIGHMETSDYADHIIGYQPAGGKSSEWLWWGRGKYIDYSPAARQRFREWLHEHYDGDVARLRKAWGNAKVSFENVEPPSNELRGRSEHMFFRDPVLGRPVIDYRRFLNDMVSGNIIRSCRIVKEMTNEKKLAGSFYGYAMAKCGSSRYLQGVAGLTNVLRSDAVDFVVTPAEYGIRDPGESGAFQAPCVASCLINGKLYWDEVDTPTHLCPRLKARGRTKTLAETLAVHRRHFGYYLTKGINSWWFLLKGNASFHDENIMGEIATMHKEAESAMFEGRRPINDVAVFFDEESLLYSNSPGSFGISLFGAHEQLTRMGAPFDMYLLSDIGNPRLPDYKVYVFLNAFHVSPELRETISKKVRRANSVVVWVYAPGYITESGFSKSNMEALTGIKLAHRLEKKKVTLHVVDSAHPIIAEVVGQECLGGTIGPLFHAVDPSVKVLGNINGRPGLVVKEMEDWRSVYCTLPLDSRLLRGVCRYGGVHVYCTTNDVFAVNKDYLMIHASTSGSKKIELPEESRILDVITGEIVIDRGLSFSFDMEAKETRLFRIETSAR